MLAVRGSDPVSHSVSPADNGGTGGTPPDKLPDVPCLDDKDGLRRSSRSENDRVGVLVADPATVDVEVEAARLAVECCCCCCNREGAFAGGEMGSRSRLASRSRSLSLSLSRSRDDRRNGIEGIAVSVPYALTGRAER